jgi:hypothetical protein
VKTQHLTPEFVDTFPTRLQPGVVYISIEFTTCAHLCPCGCGEEVITPLSPAQWSFTFNGRDVSMHPSVGNWSLPCQSHYVIDRGRVRWAAHFTKEQIATNRARDRRALAGQEDLKQSTSVSRPADNETDRATATVGPWRRLWRRFRRL